MIGESPQRHAIVLACGTQKNLGLLHLERMVGVMTTTSIVCSTALSVSHKTTDATDGTDSKKD
jgi:hypothetical protein